VGSGEGMDQKPETTGGHPRFYALYQAQEMAQMLKGFRLLSWEPQHRNGNSLRVDHVLATSKG
jgi:hypothetical protein